MNNSSLEHRIKQLIADLCAIDCDQLRGDGKLLGYGLDSIRATDLFLTLEEEYGIEIDETDPALGNVATVSELVALIESRRGL